MDPVISVCIVVAIVALLAIPTWCIRTGYSYGKDLGAAEEKRHVAEIKVKDFTIADLTALSEKRASIIKDMETHYANLSTDIENAAKAAQERKDILALPGSPLDNALKLLHARKAAAKDHSGGVAGPGNTSPSGASG